MDDIQKHFGEVYPRPLQLSKAAAKVLATSFLAGYSKWYTGNSSIPFLARLSCNKARWQHKGRFFISSCKSSNSLCYLCLLLGASHM